MVNANVAVRDSVAHLVGDRQRQFWVRIGKRFVIFEDTATRLTDDFKVAQHCVLTINPFDRIEDMSEVVPQSWAGILQWFNVPGH